VDEKTAGIMPEMGYMSQSAPGNGAAFPQTGC